jgi:hypothetical protein
MGKSSKNQAETGSENPVDVRFGGAARPSKSIFQDNFRFTMARPSAQSQAARGRMAT